MFSGLRDTQLIMERIEGDYLIFRVRVPQIPALREVTEVYLLGIIRDAIGPESNLISNFKKDLC